MVAGVPPGHPVSPWSQASDPRMPLAMWVLLRKALPTSWGAVGAQATGQWEGGGWAQAHQPVRSVEKGQQEKFTEGALPPCGQYAEHMGAKLRNDGRWGAI